MKRGSTGCRLQQPVLDMLRPSVDEGAKRAVHMVRRYADELHAAGFLVKIDEGGQSLIVHAKRV